MRRMYKYSLRPSDRSGICIITLPINSRIRHVGTQNGNHYLWAEVEPDARVITKTFRVFATGEDIPHDYSSVWAWHATWQDGPFVWHLFEKVA